MAIWPHPCPCGGGCWDIKPIVRLDPNEEQAQEPQRLRQPIFRGRVQSLQLGRRERHHESISGSERHEYFIVSVSTLPLAHLLVHPSPKGQQREISGPGRESERRDRGSGEQKSRTWLVRIRQEIPSRRPLVDQSVASAANCLFSVSIGGATTIMSSTPTRAGGFETLVLHRRHAHQRHSSFPDIARGAEEPEERRLRQLRPEPSCRRVTTSLPDRESPGFSPDHSRLSSPPA